MYSSLQNVFLIYKLDILGLLIIRDKEFYKDRVGIKISSHQPVTYSTDRYKFPVCSKTI